MDIKSESKEFPYPGGNFPLKDVGDSIMYSQPIEADRKLFPTLELLEARRPPLVEAAGFRFRNLELARFARENYTLEEIVALQDHMRTSSALRVTIQDAYLMTSDGVRQDIRTIGAATRETGGEMSGALWVRDQTQCASSMMEMYVLDPHKYVVEGKDAKDIFLSLLTIMSTPSQLSRFQAMIKKGHDPNFRNNSANWPYIFFHNNNLNTEKREGWQHKQDAWQMLVRDIERAIETGIISPSDIKPQHKRFLGMALPFLAAVDFLSLENAGSWEEISAVRTSTLAWDVVAIQSLARLAKKPQFDFLNSAYEDNKKYLPGAYQSSNLIQAADTMSKDGLDTIEKALPYESPNYDRDDPRYRTADASLLYLLDLGIPQQLSERKFTDPNDLKSRDEYIRQLESSILIQVMQLSDPESGGIARYGIPGESRDSYQAENFWTNMTQKKLKEFYSNPTPSGDFNAVHKFIGRDRLVPSGKPAAWIHFVSQISGWASRRYIETNNPYYYNVAQTFLNRILSTVTGENEYSVVIDNNKLVAQNIPPNRVTECYVTVSDPNEKKLVFPSPHTPLNWGIKKTAEALALFHQAVKYKIKRE